VQEVGQLTLVLVEATASREVAENGGGGGCRRRGRRARCRRLRVSRLDSLKGKAEGRETKLVVSTAWRGEAARGGDGELWPGLGFGRACAQRERTRAPGRGK
jgi:hypothetical protein